MMRVHRRDATHNCHGRRRQFSPLISVFPCALHPFPDSIMSSNVSPILFYWGFSPWASKVTAYLALRSIPHSECDQPITLPRPDIKALGVNYRRIPVLAIGRDIYCDTLCILSSLEKLFPSSTISADNPTEAALEHLLEKWTDVVVFKPAADAIPSALPLCQDPAFIKDRTELWGRDWDPKESDKLRPAGLANLQANFEFLEQLLGDGREWVIGGQGPKLADIHGEQSQTVVEDGMTDNITSGMDLWLDA